MLNEYLLSKRAARRGEYAAKKSPRIIKEGESMELKIKNLKIGSRIFMGGDDLGSFSWLKASLNSDLISEYILLYAPVHLSDRNILNKFDDSDLYHYLNGYDPAKNFCISVKAYYAEMVQATYGSYEQIKTKEIENQGFMEFFDEYETENIREFTMMSEDDLDSFSLFKKHRIRACPRNGSLSRPYFLWGKNSFGGRYIREISGTGYRSASYARSSRGVRPLCRIDPETAVIPAENGFRIADHGVTKISGVTDADIMKFLGIPGGLK